MAEGRLVSVIVPVHDGEAFIGRVLESVLQQTHRCLEVIVVDDGSRDETVAVVERIAKQDGRIRLTSQANGGVAAARNTAIGMARGDFIAPIDADDLWDPTKLERQLARMQSGGPKTGLVYSWWLWIDEYEFVLDASPRWQVEGDVLERLIEVNFVGSASVPMFRRSCVEEVGGYDTGLRAQGAEGCEDWQLALRVASRYNVGVVPAFLVGYRRRSNSMSSACDTMAKSRELVMEDCRQRRPSIDKRTFAQSNRQFGFYLASVSYWSQSYLGALKWATTIPPVTALAAAPHMAKAFVRRWRSRRGPGITIPDMRFSTYNGPESIIPFEMIYRRRWARRFGGDHHRNSA